MQPNRRSAYLIIRQGNRWTDVFRLENSRSLVIGRASSNEIPVADERASRRHAEVFFQNQDWFVRDLGSRNGTTVDGEKIDGPRILAPGNQIAVASCRMTFVHSLEDFVPPPPEGEPGNAGNPAQTQSDIAPAITHRQSKAALLESRVFDGEIPQVATTGKAPETAQQAKAGGRRSEKRVKPSCLWCVEAKNCRTTNRSSPLIDAHLEPQKSAHGKHGIHGRLSPEDWPQKTRERRPRVSPDFCRQGS